MTTYNTLNPVPSTDVRDLFDNAQNLDDFSNGPLDFYADRLGVSRQSLQGIRNASQYQILGPYAAGLLFTSYNQVFSYLGEFYAPSASLTLPYTTDGSGAPEIASFRSVGDAVLRSDLADDSDPVKGAGILGRSGQVVGSIAALRLLDKTAASQHAFATGYYAQGDGGGGAYYLDAADTTSADNGGSIIVAADGGRWKLVGTFVTARQFGAKGNGDTTGATDDTAAILAAFADPRPLVIDDGIYPVTRLLLTANGKQITFSEASLYGIATTAQDAIVTLHNFRNCRIAGVMKLLTDGDAVTPVYQGNYGCGLQLTSDSSASPTQFNTIDGLNIAYIDLGLLSGALPGQPAQASFPQSENFIRNYTQRGVNKAVFSNAINSYMTFTDHVIVPQQFESSSSWWVNANGYCARADEGTLIFIGGEFQRAISTGYSLYGKNISVVGPVWEVGTRCYATGDMSISDCVNGSMGPGTEPVVEIDAAAVGKLTLSNFVNRRPNGTATSNRQQAFLTNGNAGYRVDINNSLFEDWAWTAVNSNAHFASGSLFTFRGVTIDNSASTQPSYHLDEGQNLFTSADRTGQSMSTTGDTTTKGGWSTASGAGSFRKVTADLPAGTTSAIQFTNVGAVTLLVTTPIGTAGSRIASGDKDFIAEFWLKRMGTTTANTFITMVFYDFAGTSLGSQTLITTDGARLDINGFDQWQIFRQAVKPIAGAMYFSLSVNIPSTGGDIAITGISVK